MGSDFAAVLYHLFIKMQREALNPIRCSGPTVIGSHSRWGTVSHTSQGIPHPTTLSQYQWPTPTLTCLSLHMTWQSLESSRLLVLPSSILNFEPLSSHQSQVHARRKETTKPGLKCWSFLSGWNVLKSLAPWRESDDIQLSGQRGMSLAPGMKLGGLFQALHS